jgi:HPr kinase/phosphorylase
MDKRILIKEFFGHHEDVDFQLTLVAGGQGTSREIKVGDINRPGLSLAGFYDFFAHDRIQIFGMGEKAYMRQLTFEQRSEAYEKFFSYDILCCVFTHDEKPDSLFIEYADKKNVPVYVTRTPTTRFISLIMHAVDILFAPTVTMHATLIDVFGIGVLLHGKSGVGKSECALELIERGHRLVADDMVIIRREGESLLMGTGSPMLKHHMEIRGLGIINLRDIYGIRSVRHRKRVELIAFLEEWDSTREYDRLGLEECFHPILEVDVPYIRIPVRPGRNIPIIVETAALNHRLKKLGVNSARELDEKIQDWIAREKQ